MGARAAARTRAVKGASPRLPQTNFLRKSRPHGSRRRSPNSGAPGRALVGTRDSDRDQRPDHLLDQLMVRLLPLVKRMALQMREHLPAHVDLDDLVGAGVLGLIDAVRKFDARKHVKLESYARHRIRGAILDGLRSLDAASRDMRKKAKGAEKVYRELERKLGRPVGDDEMAGALGVSLKKWYRTVQELQPVGVDWLRPMEAAELRQQDPETLVASPQASAFDQRYRREQKAILNRAMTCLTERDRLMMSLYYERGLTMKEIGEKLGVDESRVSQLHSAALARLESRVKAMLRPARPAVPPAYAVAELGRPSL
ncbi:MAG: FliA/WhiG family RNA polymerase sigma factor [Acidobacteria bacterium]|nr:MAG: FliA/WhiG family RNA polymerase sigma factor [Acidobacteriota bacterium]PYV25072.1 MAG: FliA/WhiG family RNA polymerase sigma factor [Acidobacteriota bacterium]